MTVPHHRSVRTALIPWVIALVALLGLNAVFPNHPDGAKNEPSEGMVLSQAADDAQAQGRISHPLVFLAPDVSEGFGSNGAYSLLPMESGRAMRAIPIPDGAVRGRAPPASKLV